jgi:hypothetical protein
MKQLLLRADNTPFASRRVPIFFADKESRDSLIDEMQLTDVRPASPIRVVWEYWRAGFERSYHGKPGIVDLGEI